MVRAFEKNEMLYINPKSVRPWQHVLEPLYGYMLAGMKMFEDDAFIGAYNFGPDFSDNLTVKEIVDISIDITQT
jgi:CDP-glucose 4,6-dehydratase